MTARPRASLLSFFSGRFSGRLLRLYTLAMVAAFGGLVTAALLLFPNYTFFDYSMSSLGAWHKNPAGWWLFSLAMWVMGVMIVPYFMHVKRRFEKYTPRLARLFNACALVTAVSMVLLGFFPESPGTDMIHYLDAGFIFFGFLADACISGISLARMARAESLRQRKIVIIVSIMITVAAFLIIAIGLGMTYIISRSAFLSSIYFWEWYYLVVCIGLYLLLLEVVVSREPEP